MQGRISLATRTFALGGAQWLDPYLTHDVSLVTTTVASDDGGKGTVVTWLLTIGSQSEQAWRRIPSATMKRFVKFLVS
jgi:predicted secreted hydrolase